MNTYTLNDICELITDGSHFSPEDEGVGYPMLSVKDMGTNDFDFSNCKRVGEESFQKLLANGCKPMVNDVVVAKDGSYLKTAFPITEDRDIALLSSIAILRPNTTLVNPSYLSFFLKSKEVYRTVSLNYISGTALKRIILKGIKKIPIDLPSLQIQQHRVAIFEALSYLIQKRNQELQILDDLIKARFVELFGDLYHNTLNWDEYKFADVISLIKSGLSRRLSDEDIGIPVLRSGNIVNGTLDMTSVKYWYEKDPQGANTEDYILDDGDIIVNFINSQSQIGKGCIFRDIGRPCIYTTNCFRIKLHNNCNKTFFNSFISTEAYYRQLHNIIQPAVNQASFTTVNYLKLRLPLPPMKKQIEFEEFVSQVDKSKVAVQKSLDEAQILFDSLMQQYFG